jgi:DNA-binding CsgD family transcriptional regulator
VSCLRRALAEPPPAGERAALTFDLASAELHAGQPGPAAEHFEEGRRLADDPRMRAASALEHAVALQALGRHDDAFTVRERAVAEVADVDPDLALTIESSLVASAAVDLSRLAWARERLERRASEDPRTLAEWRMAGMRVYADAMYGDAPAEAIAPRAERAVGSGQLVDSRTGAGTTPFFASVETLWMADRVEMARGALDAVAEEAQRRGSAMAFACASGWRCMLLARAGDLAEAEADARSCAELALGQGWFDMAPPMLGYVLHVLLERGELEEAERILAESGLAERSPDNDVTLYSMVHARACMRADRGDTDGARADMAAVAARPARWNTNLTVVPAILAIPALAGLDPDEDRATAERMLREARTWGTPRAIGIALRAAGRAEGGDGGLDLMEQAVATLEEAPAPLELARALVDLGAALRRANRRTDAREPLRRALDIADSCGARQLADEARQELRAAGGRPRRPRMSGVASLTASERRTAGLAADGLSNPEIAQALFVTRKTVEAHLANAYGKLGISSRTELPRALLEPGD